MSNGHICGWANKGLVYVPAACDEDGAATGASSGRCKLQLLLHDCGTRDAPVAPPGGGALSAAEHEFAKWADANAIVLLLPRLRATTTANATATTTMRDGDNAPDVARGCWDVFGQLSLGYTLQVRKGRNHTWHVRIW